MACLRPAVLRQGWPHLHLHPHPDLWRCHVLAWRVSGCRFTWRMPDE